MAKDSAKAKKETKRRAKKEPKKDSKKDSKKEAKKESKKGKKETSEEKEEIETRPEIEKPEALKAELEQPTPAQEAKEIVEEKTEELKEEEKPEEVKEEAKEVGAVEEEAAEEEEELEIVEEKFYDLNLRRIWAAPRESRTPKAVRFLRDFVARRMKTDEVSISEEANSMLWARGISKPPRHIRVRAVKDKEGRVIVFPGEVK
jgi:ribosomal protein L31E